MQSFRISAEASEALHALAARTGKSKTRIIEDKVLAREYFPPNVEAFLLLEMQRSNRTRDEILAEAVLKYLVEAAVNSAKDIAAKMAKEQMELAQKQTAPTPVDRRIRRR